MVEEFDKRYAGSVVPKRKWIDIADTFNQRNSKNSLRTSRQCREHWQLALPSISKEPFTAKEDEAILAKEKELGPKWTKIAQSLESRTGQQVKNRFQVLRSGNQEGALAIVPEEQEKPAAIDGGQQIE